MNNKEIVLDKKQLKKLHEVELDILVEFDRICRKHNIKYMLGGGTLLGAIRHNGFIPWDDDIDVSMLREDYDKFIKIQKKELNTEKYLFESLETDDNCGMLYSKIRRKGTKYLEYSSAKEGDNSAIWIDVFPFDNIPDDSFISQLRFKYIYCLRMILLNKTGYLKGMKDKKKNFIVKIIKILSIFYNKNRLKRKLLRFINKFNDIETDKVVSYAGVYVGKEIIDKHFLENLIEHEFEGKKFFIPKDYDKYLKHYYGDYMKLPPKEKRITHPVIDIKFPDE